MAQNLGSSAHPSDPYRDMHLRMKRDVNQSFQQNHDKTIKRSRYRTPKTPSITNNIKNKRESGAKSEVLNRTSAISQGFPVEQQSLLIGVATTTGPLESLDAPQGDHSRCALPNEISYGGAHYRRSDFFNEHPPSYKPFRPSQSAHDQYELHLDQPIATTTTDFAWLELPGDDVSELKTIHSMCAELDDTHITAPERPLSLAIPQYKFELEGDNPESASPVNPLSPFMHPRKAPLPPSPPPKTLWSHTKDGPIAHPDHVATLRLHKYLGYNKQTPLPSQSTSPPIKEIILTKPSPIAFGFGEEEPEWNPDMLTPPKPKHTEKERCRALIDAGNYRVRLRSRRLRQANYKPADASMRMMWLTQREHYMRSLYEEFRL